MVLKYLINYRTDAEAGELLRRIGGGAVIHSKPGGQAPLSMVFTAPCMGVLLGAGADPHSKDKWGRTALHYASGRTWELVKILLEAGADPNAVDEDGLTPLHLACAEETEWYIFGNCDPVSIIELLIKYGANIHLRNRWGRVPADTPGILIEAAVFLVENGSPCKKVDPLIVVARQVYLNKIREATLMAMHSRLGCESGLAQLGSTLLRAVLEHV